MYSIHDLCEQFNVSRYTINNYIRIGVLPGAKLHGRYSYYTDEHVRLLKRIRAEVHDRTRLADLAERRLYETSQRA